MRNNGGGHANHSMFWKIMAAQRRRRAPAAVARAINTTFGSFDASRKSSTPPRPAVSAPAGPGW